jgi:hypothetical protein
MPSMPAGTDPPLVRTVVVGTVVAVAAVVDGALGSPSAGTVVLVPPAASTA